MATKPASLPLALYTYAELLGLAVGFLPVMALASVRHRGDVTRRIPGRWMRRFGRTASRLTPVWDFSWQGTPPADIGHAAYVVVSNHESNADPFLLTLLPWDMRWVAKEAVFELPLLGLLMRASGDIELRRGDRGSIGAMYDACLATLRGGLSVMMFPEGTRSRDGALLPFKDGAFRLAIEAQVPVLMLALAGTRDCMRKGALGLGRARAKVRVLESIPTAGLTEADVPALREQARARIGAAARELRRELA
ncbi:MAG: 1-acyl-sn-glycerol-3-phosphate acyltransferase [Myxococcales bacterium]|nr:1-acyl-sn-glycerol-3-phosphate acyltransferase [Myxococcales bacterium]